ncbi:hypothetical protein AYI69_g3982 [Smittium culicis]|uniref:Reverse transcriptase domain-containing protein n=1 Tax=Smittium culicis TaxID=133412 RepID=A0A1R1YHW2_9FUNG|nr:hypothetical protein AYI69_g3982 [Smittium culicis]
MSSEKTTNTKSGTKQSNPGKLSASENDHSSGSQGIDSMMQAFSSNSGLHNENSFSRLSNQYIQHLIPNVGQTNLFSGKGVDEFIELYELITSGLKDERKVKLFTRYCEPCMIDEIKWSDEYESGNWREFCEMLRNRYKKKKKLDPFLEINKLVSGGINLENAEIFLQNFNFLTSKLIKDEYITVRQKTDFLLKSLPSSLVEKLSSDLVINGEFKPYSDLVTVISDHFNTEKRMANYITNRSKITYFDKIKENENDKSKIEEAENKPLNAEKPTTEKETNTEILSLIKQMGSMVLTIKNSIDGANLQNKAVSKYGERTIKCIYCDGEHSKRDCAELTEDIAKGLVKLDQNKNVLLANGEPLKPNYGNGGMKINVISDSKSVKTNLICVKDDLKDECPEKFSNESMVYKSETNEVGQYNLIYEDEFTEIMSFASKRKLEDVTLYERVNKQKFITEETEKSEKDKIETENIFFENPPYQMKAKIVNTGLQESVLKKCKESLITLSLEEVASVSPLIRKSLNDNFRIKKEIKVDNINSKEDDDPKSNWKKKYLSVGSGKKIGTVQGVRMLLMFDEGSEVNIMSEAVYKGLKSLNRAKIDESIQWKMRDANAGSSDLLGVVKDVEIEIDGIKVKNHVFVSDKIEAAMILGRPWEVKSRVSKENRKDGSLWYTIIDECTNNTSTFCVSTSEDSRRFEDKPELEKMPFDVGIYGIETIKSISDWGYEPSVMTRYKAAKDKIKPALVQLEEKESPKLQIKDMKSISNKTRLTECRIAKIIVGEGNLSIEEQSLFIREIKECDKAFAFKSDEMGILRDEVEKPVIVETIEHVPWQVKPFPIPKGIFHEVKDILKEKILSGILEPTNGPYSNNWFCIKKKTGGYRFIQDVRNVNAVTKKNAAKPPLVDAFAEDFSCCKIYTTFDLMSGYDQISLDESSRDLFSLQTPLGLLRMTRLPQGWTNSVQVFQRLMTKVFIKHIPEILGIFVDDGCIKGVREGGEEEIYPGIRRYVYEHIQDVKEVLTTMIQAGMLVVSRATLSMNVNADILR